MGFLGSSNPDPCCTLHRSFLPSPPPLPSSPDILHPHSCDPLPGSGLSHASSTDLEDLAEDFPDIVDAVQTLLRGLGEDVNRDGLLKTPLRVARALSFATKGYRQVAKNIVGDALFPEAGAEPGLGYAGGFGGMVVVRNIDLYSLCEGCLLPFKVCCHIAYISSGYQVVGLSKLPRVADMYARRIQNPQTLADQISQGLADTIKPLGVGIVLQSWHLPVPGMQHELNASKDLFLHYTVTLSGKGQFEDKSGDAWMEFLAMLQFEGINIDEVHSIECNGSHEKVFCPCVPLDDDALNMPHPTITSTYSNGNHRTSHHEHIPVKPYDKVSAMVTAVEVILDSLVGGSTEEERGLTAKRFIGWILNFRRKDFELAHCNGMNNGSMEGKSNSLKSLKSGFSLEMVDSPVQSSDLVAELGIPFCSLCEHHLLPFFGKAHVGFFSAEATLKPVNISAILQLVDAQSHKLQVQERLTKDIAEAIIRLYGLTSIIVVLEASHICMVSRGVEKLGSSTVTIAVFGIFSANISAKAAFLKRIANNNKGFTRN